MRRQAFWGRRNALKHCRNLRVCAVDDEFSLFPGRPIRGHLGETGIRILMRFTGLILVAIAVQFIVNGASGLGVVHLNQK